MSERDRQFIRDFVRATEAAINSGTHVVNCRECGKRYAMDRTRAILCPACTETARAFDHDMRLLVDQVIVSAAACPALDEKQREWAIEQLRSEYSAIAPIHGYALPDRDLLAAVYSTWANWVACNVD